MICFYHSADLDGICSAAIIKLKHPECVLVPINYSDNFPWISVMNDEHDTVFMVDFSLQPYEKMGKLHKLLGDKLVWIDHHITAIEAVDPTIKGLRRNGIGACQLVWEYLHPNEPVPYAIQLLAQYDVWDHSNPDTLPFQYGMRMSLQEGPGDVLWKNVMHGVGVSKIASDGELIIAYDKKLNEGYAAAGAFETKYGGLKLIAMNRLCTNSLSFESVWDNTKYDAMCAFGWARNKWKVSLYTDKPGVDVAEICKRYGGGGHKQAAGFYCSELPFKLWA